MANDAVQSLQNLASIDWFEESILIFVLAVYLSMDYGGERFGLFLRSAFSYGPASQNCRSSTLLKPLHDTAKKPAPCPRHISPQALSSQTSLTLSGWFILSVILRLLSITHSLNLLTAISMVSPPSSFGRTLCFKNSFATTATNSTCANFFPGQTRGPEAQGMKVPAGGCSTSSVPGLGEVDAMMKRSGRKARASGPQ